jgi:hypothetical protein
MSRFTQAVNLRNRPQRYGRAVSRRRPIAAARVRARVKSYGICDELSGTGTSFLRVLRFSLLLIHLAKFFKIIIIIIHHQGLVNLPVNGSSNSGLVASVV